MSSHSPIIKKQETEKKQKFLNFYEALKICTDKNKKITRKEWPEGTYGVMKNETLHIFTKGELHQWIISDGDLCATDWIIA